MQIFLNAKQSLLTELIDDFVVKHANFNAGMKILAKNPGATIVSQIKAELEAILSCFDKSLKNYPKLSKEYQDIRMGVTKGIL